MLRKGEKAVGGLGELPHLGEDAGFPRFDQFVEKDVVALEGHEHGHAELSFQRGDGAAYEEVGEADEVGLRHIAQPRDEATHFLALIAVLPFHHREGERSEFLGADGEGARGDALDEARVVEPAVEEGGKVAEERNLLLEVDIDPAEEDLVDGAILLVDADGGVERQQGDIPPERGEAGGESVVAQAATAIHAAGAGGEVDDFGWVVHGKRNGLAHERTRMITNFGSLESNSGSRVDSSNSWFKKLPDLMLRRHQSASETDSHF